MTQARSHFQEELRIIPTGWVVASVVCFAAVAVLFQVFIPMWQHHHDLPPQPWWALLGFVGALFIGGNDPADWLRLRRCQTAGHERAAVDAAGHPDSQGDWLHCLLPAAQAAAGAVSQLPVADRIGLCLLPEVRICSYPKLCQLRTAHPARLHVLPVLREDGGSHGDLEFLRPRTATGFGKLRAVRG